MTSVEPKTLLEAITQLPSDVVTESLWAWPSLAERRTYRQLNKAARQHANQSLTRHLKLHSTSSTLQAVAQVLVSSQQQPSRRFTRLQALSITHETKDQRAVTDAGASCSVSLATLSLQPSHSHATDTVATAWSSIMAGLGQHNPQLVELFVTIDTLSTLFLTAVIAPLASLRRLELTGFCCADDVSFAPLQDATNLTYLKVATRPDTTGILTTATLATLPPLAHLAELNLTFSVASSTACYSFTTPLPSLTHLRVVLAESIGSLSWIMPLIQQHLTLECLEILCNNDRESIAHWDWIAANLKSLTQLCVQDGSCHPTLAQLASMTQLTEVQLPALLRVYQEPHRTPPPLEIYYTTAHWLPAGALHFCRRLRVVGAYCRSRGLRAAEAAPSAAELCNILEPFSNLEELSCAVAAVELGQSDQLQGFVDLGQRLQHVRRVALNLVLAGSPPPARSWYVAPDLVELLGSWDNLTGVTLTCDMQDQLISNICQFLTGLHELHLNFSNLETAVGCPELRVYLLLVRSANLEVVGKLVSGLPLLRRLTLLSWRVSVEDVDAIVSKLCVIGTRRELLITWTRASMMRFDAAPAAAINEAVNDGLLAAGYKLIKLQLEE